jgi:3-deoxy-D-manno-octulosonic-acid transferase
MVGLLFYRFIVLPLALEWQLLRHIVLIACRRIPFADLAERLGRLNGVQGRSLWIHGASLGELGPARHLIEEILERDPDISVVVTANTSHARALIRSWNMNRVVGALAPFDARWSVRRFLSGVELTHHIAIENELWPNRFIVLAKQGIPIIAVSARISARSVQRWRILGSFARELLSLVRFVAPQSPDSRANLLALGLRADQLLPDLNLKSLVPPNPPAPEDLAAFTPHFTRAKTILLASTHPGEEAILLPVFAKLLQKDPELRLIIAPRRVDRGPEIGELAQKQGLSTALRSQKDAPVAQVYVADTLFEMPLWYTLACITFVGGSLSDYGGHTPFEPAAFSSAIVHGPFTSNFLDVYRQFDSAGAALQLDTETAGETIWQLLDDDGKRALLTGKALLTLESKKDALSPFLDTFLPSKARTL